MSERTNPPTSRSDDRDSMAGHVLAHVGIHGADDLVIVLDEVHVGLSR